MIMRGEGDKDIVMIVEKQQKVRLDIQSEKLYSFCCVPLIVKPCKSSPLVLGCM